MLDSGVSINSQSNNGETFLHRIMMYSNQINNNSTNSNSTSNNNNDDDPSSMEEDTSLVEYLLDKGANMNVLNRHGETPLHYCARYGRKSIASMLVERGADVTISGSLRFPSQQMNVNIR